VAGGWLSAGATVAGTAHVRRAEPRQDALSVRHTPAGNAVVLALADGAGSAERGGAGAAIAVRALRAAGEAACGRAPIAELDGPMMVDAMAAARRAVLNAAERAAIAPRALATTALLVVSDGSTTLAAHVGDGAAVVRLAADRSWCALSWPERGEYAGMTRFLTEDPPAPVRVARLEDDVSALAVLTDGLERLVLDLAAGTPHPPFFDMIAAPLDTRACGGATAGRDRRLSRALARYLSGEAVCERTDDDKTLAIAVRLAGDGAPSASPGAERAAP